MRHSVPQPDIVYTPQLSLRQLSGTNLVPTHHNYVSLNNDNQKDKKGGDGGLEKLETPNTLTDPIPGSEQNAYE